VKSDFEKLRKLEFELISERKLTKRLTKDLKRLKYVREEKKLRKQQTDLNMSLMEELSGLATEPSDAVNETTNEFDDFFASPE
jgi:hypothetical protein